LFSPIRKVDPFFGQLRYLRDAKFWEGKINFVPLQRRLEILIDGTAAGPSEEQAQLYKEIESRYNEIWPYVQDKLKSEARNIKLENIKSFELVCISITEDIQTPTFELSYEARPPSWNFTVMMENWQPTNALAEC
jgi:hypothetical protein